MKVKEAIELLSLYDPETELIHAETNPEKLGTYTPVRGLMFYETASIKEQTFRDMMDGYPYTSKYWSLTDGDISVVKFC